MSRIKHLQKEPTRSQSTPPGGKRRPRTPSRVLYDRQKAMIVSLHKVQKQYEQQRSELLEQWAEARVLWEDERSFLIDERNAVMVEYKNIAVEKAKLQKELSQLVTELTDGHASMSKNSSTCSFTSRVLSNHINDSWIEYVAKLQLGSLHLYNPDTNQDVTTITVYQATTNAIQTNQTDTNLTESNNSTSTSFASFQHHFSIQIDDATIMFAVKSAEDRDKWIHHINQISTNTRHTSQSKHESYIMNLIYESGGSDLCEAVHDYIQRTASSTSASSTSSTLPTSPAPTSPVPTSLPTSPHSLNATDTKHEHKIKTLQRNELVRPLARIQKSPTQEKETKQTHTPATIRANRERMSARLDHLRKRMTHQKQLEIALGSKVVKV